jgi:hypothetical protein
MDAIGSIRPSHCTVVTSRTHRKNCFSARPRDATIAAATSLRRFCWADFGMHFRNNSVARRSKSAIAVLGSGVFSISTGLTLALRMCRYLGYAQAHA